MQDLEAVWLNKYISESGICSRREADKLIEDGKVTINRELAIKGDQVFPGDKVRIDGRLIRTRNEEDIIFIALNKPVGIVSTTEKIKDNIINFVNHPDRIFPLGRLDKDSEGLIFLTNNGDMVNKILRAGNNHEKEYMVTVDRPLTDAVIAGLANGVPIMGTQTKKCKVEREGVNSFRITLVQGLNRQIRRMCEYFEYEVVKLKRIRIMNISLKGLPLGEWRDLTEQEMGEIYKLTATSSSENIVMKELKTSPPFSKNKPERLKLNDKPKAVKKSQTKKSVEKDYKEKTEFERKRNPTEPKYPKTPSVKRIGKSKPKSAVKTTKSGKPYMDRGATKSNPIAGGNTGRSGSQQRTKKGGY
jgi:23S rRNA pseudouridine2604 synthase